MLMGKVGYDSRLRSVAVIDKPKLSFFVRGREDVLVPLTAQLGT
jgi:hypothetical protein